MDQFNSLALTMHEIYAMNLVNSTNWKENESPSFSN